MTTETQLGDRDDAHALMLELRKIILMQGEDVYFPRIAGIVHKAARDANLKRENARNLKIWEVVMTEGVVLVDEGAGPHRTPKASFDLVVNARSSTRTRRSGRSSSPCPTTSRTSRGPASTR